MAFHASAECSLPVAFSTPSCSATARVAPKGNHNAFVETFNSSFRNECLNVHWFDSLDDAKAIIEAWRRDYNESRPHMALNNVSPAVFVRQTAVLMDPQGP
jgi:putative transposase